MDVNKLPVLFLMGPTASGKTDLVATLHERFNVELISVDAAQVYRGMNIGTAKPDQHFLERYPHHLIDIKDPDEYYSAAEFRVDATRLIRDIHGRGKLPVLVGGTMFYFSALEKGLSDLPASDDIVRSEIETELERHGLSNLYQRLVEVDPVMAQRINHKDQQRVLRALEIYRITGSPPSVVMARSRLIGLNSPIVKLALFTTNRRTLHHRIKLRFDLMMEEGLIDEVKGLLGSFQCSDQMPSMRTVGYRQPIEYLRGNLTEKEMIDSSVAATRQLAKRQLTWLRQQSNVVWFDISGQKSESVSRYMEANPLLLKII